MAMDQQDEINELRIQAYDNYLKAMDKSERLQYFDDMNDTDIIELIKCIYGNDGKDDCAFEY